VYTVAVCLLGAVWPIGSLPQSGTTPWLQAVLLVAAAALAGAFPVRFASCRTSFAPTHPFILCALALAGPFVAVLAGVAGVVGSTLRRRLPPLRFAFNVGASSCAIGISYVALRAAGGTPGADWTGLLLPLLAAATAYFVANSGLVAIAVALDTRCNPLHAWRRTFAWTAAAYFSGLSLAVGLLVLLALAGPWTVLLGLPPVAVLVQLYESRRRRLEESERRVAEVERLNRELESTVGELREALAHVKSLQGLLPICMHCKSIRDDNDIWHRIEAYISRHTDVTFTHSLCKPCQEKYYPHDREANTDREKCSE
jgi:hypothetical protein